MNFKKLKIISIFIVFGLSFLFHSAYEMFPNVITSFLFPVNESIWEHMKLIFLGYVITGIIEYFIINKYNLKTNNLKASIVFNVLFNISFFLVIFIPINMVTEHNLFITLSVYLLSIIITQILSYKIITSKKEYSFLNKYSYIILIIIFLMLIYLTYFPLKNKIFIDETNKKIGLNNLY